MYIPYDIKKKITKTIFLSNKALVLKEPCKEIYKRKMILKRDQVKKKKK